MIKDENEDENLNEDNDTELFTESEKSISELMPVSALYEDIEYIDGDSTCPQSKGNKIIAHVCNTYGGWGKGFVLAVSKKWEEPEREYRKWHRERKNNDFALGAIQLVYVEKYIWVANMIAQKGVKKKTIIR